jgi:hypothetical protein
MPAFMMSGPHVPQTAPAGFLLSADASQLFVFSSETLASGIVPIIRAQRSAAVGRNHSDSACRVLVRINQLARLWGTRSGLAPPACSC